MYQNSVRSRGGRRELAPAVGEVVKRILPALLCVLMLCPTAGLFAQRRAGQAHPAQGPPAHAGTPSPSPATPFRLEPSGPSLKMGAAFREGRLPEPLPLPVGSGDEQAAALAASVAKGDEQSTPALLTALLAAGFAIRKSDGTILKTSGTQGLTIPEWEVAATAKQYGRGQTIGMGNFERAMQRLTGRYRGAHLRGWSLGFQFSALARRLAAHYRREAEQELDRRERERERLQRERDRGWER